LGEAGFGDIRKELIAKINSTIAEATAKPEGESHHAWAQDQVIIVTRWNAMRELFDAMEAFIADTKAERDRIQEMQREEEQLQWLQGRQPISQGEL
jgi:hypothetical protein